MLWLFDSDLSLYILSFLEFKDVFALYLLARDIHRFLAQHETAVFHQLAIRHRFVLSGISLEDAARAEEHREGWLHGVQSWKELCHRCVLMERNWAGRGTVVQGAYLTFEGDVRSFEIDEVERTIIAIVDEGGKHNLVVRAIEDGRELWTLAGISQVEHSNGYLLLTRDVARNPGGLEVWIRAADSLAATEQGPYSTPLQEPSPLALTAKQRQATQRINTSGDTRGRYIPHGFIPSFTGDFFRTVCFRYPLAAVIDSEDVHVAQVYDVMKGIHTHRIDLDKLASASAPRHRPFQPGSLLLDIDMSSDYFCAAFDSGVLITSLRDCAVADSASSAVASAVLFDEELSPWVIRRSELQLKKSDVQDERSERGNVVSDGPVMSLLCSSAGTMERFQIVPPSEEDEDSQALTRSNVRASAFFISAKFSPDGRHLIVGSAFGIVYLLPNVHDILSGLTKLQDVVQKVNVGEPLRDVLWEEQHHRVLIRTEPGYTFVADLDPAYHKGTSAASEGSLGIKTASVHRLCDFCSPYGTLYGNIHMTRTRIWFVWDAARLREGVLERTEGNPEPAALIHKNKVVSVCFMNFAPIAEF